MIRIVLELARHELVIILRTKRALVACGMYLGFATAGGLGYTMLVRWAQVNTTNFLINQGIDPQQAPEAAETVGSQLFYTMISFMVAMASLRFPVA